MPGVPYIFGNATTSIPLSNLDANFNTGLTIGNTTVGLGNTVTTLGNVTLTNATVSSASITDSGLTSGRAVYTGTGGLLSANANLTYDGTTFTAVNDASISGLTVGKGGGSLTNNTAVGANALSATNTGSGLNTAVGVSVLASNTSGQENNAFGASSLGNNTTGSQNTAIGRSALASNTTASNNTAVGYQAGYNTTGGLCTYVGTGAGTTTTSGSNITCIGYATNPASATDTNELVIGTGTSTGKGSNTGFFNNNFGGTYQGNNSAAWSITSDQRLKKNIVDNTVGLSAITAIQVRNFEYRTANEVTDLPSQNAIEITGVQIGAIDQVLQAVLPDCVKTESTGVMSVDTTNIVWHLINAVKELNATVTAQADTIAALQTKVGV